MGTAGNGDPCGDRVWGGPWGHGDYRDMGTRGQQGPQRRGVGGPWGQGDPREVAPRGHGRQGDTAHHGEGMRGHKATTAPGHMGTTATKGPRGGAGGGDTQRQVPPLPPAGAPRCVCAVCPLCRPPPVAPSPRKAKVKAESPPAPPPSPPPLSPWSAAPPPRPVPWGCHHRGGCPLGGDRPRARPVLSRPGGRDRDRPPPRHHLLGVAAATAVSPPRGGWVCARVIPRTPLRGSLKAPSWPHSRPPPSPRTWVGHVSPPPVFLMSPRPPQGVPTASRVPTAPDMSPPVSPHPPSTVLTVVAVPPHCVLCPPRASRPPGTTHSTPTPPGCHVSPHVPTAQGHQCHTGRHPCIGRRGDTPARAAPWLTGWL